MKIKSNRLQPRFIKQKKLTWKQWQCRCTLIGTPRVSKLSSTPLNTTSHSDTGWETSCVSSRLFAFSISTDVSLWSFNCSWLCHCICRMTKLQCEGHTQLRHSQWNYICSATNCISFNDISGDEYKEMTCSTFQMMPSKKKNKDLAGLSDVCVQLTSH